MLLSPPALRLFGALATIVLVGCALGALPRGTAPRLQQVAAPAVPQLPAPTGPYRIAKADALLVDHRRTDPWTRSGPRRLMASLWYPAAATAGRPRAPWMSRPLVREFAANAGRILGVPSGRID
ncbi:hypothetical protein [Streptomyces rhizosphaericus]|uniref:hypothetical protein n=1 Tax=Streptomyces rhizosphaericus TaxID=114699 RepID=UPI000A378B5A|nr:hypothetical protein [Streptomyces rhizosphaericus]